MRLSEDWDQLTPDEKYELRFKILMEAEGVEFANKEIEVKYQKTVKRIKDVVELKKPDRVPVIPLMNFYPAKYGGINAKEAMYDYDKLKAAWIKYHKDFEPDTLSSCFLIGSGPLFETLDYKLYNWPGNGTTDNFPYQCVEKEYMKAEEYDLMINDPSGYWMRYYLPRIFGSLAPWQKLAPFTDLVELPFVGAVMVPVGMPDVQEAYKKYLEAGQKAIEWIQAVGEIDGQVMATQGLPSLIAGFSKAPYDTIGDTLRGTRGIMMDMYRHPDKLIEAMEKLAPIMIEMGVRTATMNKSPFVFIPLHKGEDTFLSDDDYAKFYWPTLKSVIKGLIEEGCVPYIFVEGAYNKRLDYLADPDLPKGKIIWTFDKTDMKKAKKYLGNKACIGGNVSSSLLKMSEPEEVREYVRNLIDDVAGDGGYILSNGAALDVAEAENLKAMIETGKEYGKY